MHPPYTPNLPAAATVSPIAVRCAAMSGDFAAAKSWFERLEATGARVGTLNETGLWWL